MEDELTETYNGPAVVDPAPVVVVTPPADTVPVEEEIEEIEVLNEERHTEVTECLRKLEALSLQILELQQRPTENPLLVQLQTQQAEMIVQINALNQKLSGGSHPRTPSSTESTPTSDETRTGPPTDGPVEESVPAPTPAPKKRRFRVT